MSEQEKIERHIEAARLLDNIKDDAFKLIGGNDGINEYEVKQFILNEFKKRGLKSDCNDCIVAFRHNTSYVHYLPSQYCLKIKPGSLIMIDIWARLKERNSPYADITWMAYKGEKVPPEINKAFDSVVKAREKAIKGIKESLGKNELITGQEADRRARDEISGRGYKNNFRHTLGHSLGIKTPHGKARGLTPKNKNKLKRNTPYTIEPGIYLKNFGVRSEIDFYIGKNNKFHLTSRLQNKVLQIL